MQTLGETVPLLWDHEGFRGNAFYAIGLRQAQLRNFPSLTDNRIVLRVLRLEQVRSGRCSVWPRMVKSWTCSHISDTATTARPHRSRMLKPPSPLKIPRLKHLTFAFVDPQ